MRTPAIHRLVLLAVISCVFGWQASSIAAPSPAPDRLVVGCKKFPESALLAEILAQALEHKGIVVERRFNMGNTAITFEALKQGSIDVYPEYDGTVLGLLGIDRNEVDRSQITGVVRRELAHRFKLSWGPPLGFNNSYAIAVHPALAQRHSLESLSDLARLSREQPLKAAFTHEFLAREDGFEPLARDYKLELSPRATEHGVAYQLIAQGQVDVIDVYTTEGLIAEHGLQLAVDDQGFFPPYQAAYVYGDKFKHSALALAALTDLSGTLGDERMRALNQRVEVAGNPIADVARSVTGDRQGVGLEAAQTRKRMSFFSLLYHDRYELLGHLGRHLQLTLLAMLLCLIAALPLGYLASRTPLAASLSLGLSGALQTIPSLALLVLAIPIVSACLAPLGQQDLVLETSAVLALFLYSLLPVVRNTKQGLQGIDPAILEAARGTGMTGRQLLVWVQVPLAMPMILAGVRTSFVITVGTATLAAFVGAGGLGVPIISGLSVHNFTEVWTGAVPATLLALASDAVFAVVQRRLTSNVVGSNAAGS